MHHASLEHCRCSCSHSHVPPIMHHPRFQLHLLQHLLHPLFAQTAQRSTRSLERRRVGRAVLRSPVKSHAGVRGVHGASPTEPWTWREKNMNPPPCFGQGQSSSFRVRLFLNVIFFVVPCYRVSLCRLLLFQLKDDRRTSCGNPRTARPPHCECHYITAQYFP